MGTLSFINDLAQWLGRWIPRLVLIEPTHRGVLFGPRGSARLTGPGLVCYWPITHALELVPVTTRSVQLNAQVLPLERLTVPGIVPHIMLCGVAVQFRVEDAVLAATKALHINALVDNRVQASVARHRAHSGNLEAWANAVVSDLRLELAPFGIVVERLDFTQHGTGVALKNVSDWNYSDSSSGARPTP
jgi:regulator of protease activity HflC (stomatin/prohibitin superfamily)